jgi:hypothetical protein
MRNRQKWLMVSLSALIVVNVAAPPSTLAALNELVGGGDTDPFVKTCSQTTKGILSEDEVRNIITPARRSPPRGGGGGGVPIVPGPVLPPINPGSCTEPCLGNCIPGETVDAECCLFDWGCWLTPGVPNGQIDTCKRRKYTCPAFDESGNPIRVLCLGPGFDCRNSEPCCEL